MRFFVLGEGHTQSTRKKKGIRGGVLGKMTIFVFRWWGDVAKENSE